jgi:dipeptidyl aminopeptidase/acylaminoacyl peptidase
LADYADVGPSIELQPVVYRARDGLLIPAYLALPGPAADGPYPTILLPHGGPYARDTDHFDYWVQYFVSRGYAVLKPNFRGSTGYGDEFVVAGFDQWGLKMQDDVMDGLDWMIAEKYTDPARVCIVGASYGGYVASVAAFKTPRRFRCAVSFAGVSSLDDLVSQWQNLRFSEQSIQRVQTGSTRDANSPLVQVEQVAVPLLIVHGDLDRRVFVEQSRDFADKLKQAGKSFTYIEQADGNHHLSLQHHRTEFFLAMDKFLQSHLGSVDAIE